MTMIDNAKARGIAARAKAIILHPRSEWDVIAAEPATVRSLFTGYVLYMAAIPPVCGFIGGLLFSSLWHPLRQSPIGLAVSAILAYALSLASVYVMGLIIEAIAPYFGGAKDRVAAMKVSAFFPTAWWLSGVFSLIPVLGALRLLGLFSLFLLWLGLPKLMRVPEDKATLYTLSVVVVAIIVTMLIDIIAGAVAVSTLALGAA